MKGIPQLGLLASRARKPSWVNNAGRVDRSACFEVRASELWPLVEAHQWEYPQGSAGPLACANFTITAPLLHNLHQMRSPHQLIGDLRTPKSNAMKRPDDPQAGARQHLKPGDQPWRAVADALEYPYANPNKGATQAKKLALWSGAEAAYQSIGPWQQSIRIERHIRNRNIQSKIRNDARKIRTFRRLPKSQIASPPNPPNFWHYVICPQCNRKVFKLLMVLAMADEIDDAEIAEGWIKMVDARLAATHRTPSPQILQLRAELIDRYGQLFRGRRLICRKCLGVRYGEVRRSDRGGRKADPDRAAERSRERRRADQMQHEQRERQSAALLRQLLDNSS